MPVITFRVPGCSIAGLFLACWISFVHPIHAAPYLASSTVISQQHNKPSLIPNELQADPASTTKTVEETVVHIVNDSTLSASKNANHTLVISKLLRLKDIISPNTLLWFFGFGADKAISLMTGVENFLNARSNIDDIDNVMTAFNKVFLSKASEAILTYQELFSNFLVNLDAIGQFVRGIGNRFVVRRVRIQSDTAEEEASGIIDETLLSLTAANAQLEDFKNSLENLIRRQGIARIGTVSRNEDTVWSQNELNEMDDESDEEKDEEENKLDDQTVADRTLVREYVDDEVNDTDRSSDAEDEGN